MIPSSFRSVSIVALIKANADVNVSMATASEATPTRVTATITQVGRRVDSQIWLKVKDIEMVKVISKGTRLRYFEQTKTVVQRGQLMPVKGVMEVLPNVPSDILVIN